jgi:hypothetical protein
MPTSTTSIQIIMEILGQRNYATKRKKKASKLERKKLNCPF